jgi:hypothetical protein
MCLNHGVMYLWRRSCACSLLPLLLLPLLLLPLLC